MPKAMPNGVRSEKRLERALFRGMHLPLHAGAQKPLNSSAFHHISLIIIRNHNVSYRYLIISVACAARLAVVEDLKESLELARTLWRLPSKAEPWIKYAPPMWAAKEEVKKIKDMSELDFARA